MATLIRWYTPATIDPYRAKSNDQVVTYNPQNQFPQTYPWTNQYSWNWTNFNSGYDALKTVANIVDPSINVPFASWNEALNTVAWIVNWNTVATPTTNVATPTIPSFNTLDNLNMQSQAWSESNPNIASAYQTLANWLWSYSNVANQIWDFYNTAANQIANREAQYANAQYNLANQLNQDLANQRDYIWGMFGPQWQLTQEINKYYDDMGNYLASEGWRQMANVAAQGARSWASLWLLRAQQNEAYNNAFQNYLKVKEQEINAKQSIQAQLIDYMTKLRQEYGNTTNQYILGQYQRANDLLNSLDADLKNQYTNLALARLQWGGWSGGSSNSTSLSDLVNSLGLWNNWWANWWQWIGWWIDYINTNWQGAQWQQQQQWQGWTSNNNTSTWFGEKLGNAIIDTAKRFTLANGLWLL